MKKTVKFKEKLFTFVPFDEWGRSWDTTTELSVDNVIESDTDTQLNFGIIRYYGLNGFKGLVALEPASEKEDGSPDYDEQLDAAKYGCNIIYEYIK